MYLDIISKHTKVACRAGNAGDGGCGAMQAAAQMKVWQYSSTFIRPKCSQHILIIRHSLLISIAAGWSMVGGGIQVGGWLEAHADSRAWHTAGGRN